MARPVTKKGYKDLRFEPKCSVCKKSLRDKRLHERILASKKFFPGSKDAEKLIDIGRAYGISTQVIYGHVNKHVVVNADEMSTKEMERIAKRAVVKTEFQNIQEGQRATEVWDEVIGTAMDELKNGNLKLTANHLLKAAKDKTDFEIKKKNQDMAIQEMMWHYASGEALGSTLYDARRITEGGSSEDYNPAEVFAGYIDQGEERPSDLYPGTTGDAATSGSDNIPPGDDF